MVENTRWKWLLLVVLGVLTLAMALVYPPSRTLKAGADLGGGHTFIYEVDVPAGSDTRQVIDQTIEVLKQRVDPAGVMNLVWRRLAGNRFEVQMPAAGREVKDLRARYLDTRDQLLATNLSRATVEQALGQESPAREARLLQLSRGDDDVASLLSALAGAHDAHAAAKVAADEAEAAQTDVEQRLEAAGADVPDALKQDVETKEAALLEKVQVLLVARKQLNGAWDALLGTNISESALEVALTQSADPVRDPDTGKPAPSPRQTRLDLLVKRHPGRAKAIVELGDAYAAYEQVKGPLDDPNDLIVLLRGSGVLEFRIAPTVDKLADADDRRKRLVEEGPRGEPGDPYRWFLIDDDASFAETAAEQQRLKEDPAGYLADDRGLVGGSFSGDPYLLLHAEGDASITQADTWELAAAYGTPDERGFPAIGFELNAPGAQLMGKLTSGHQGEPMAIVLDGRVMSAPVIRSTITRNGIITGGSGGFGPLEYQYLKRTLNAGSLQARVSDEPIYQRSFDAAFGRDNLERGLRASLWALAAVAAFMALYYLYNGLIADFALVGNVLIILAIMSTNFLSATFTLPGIAGIVLTIGMAVDANVLIFERIREELERGAEVHTAVRTGYGKALATIIDANITTLITCVVLGYTATAEVKGFAVTLGIGILATMFTVLLGTRVLVELYVQWTGAKTLAMLPTLVPAIGRRLSPGIDWVSKRIFFVTASVVLMVGGLLLVYARGQDMLDIEFRSGTQISFNLAEGKQLDIREVKERLTRQAEASDMAQLAGNRAKVVLVGRSEGTRGSAFSVSTLEADKDDRVSRAIKEAFQDVLLTKLAIRFERSELDKVDQAPVRSVTVAHLGGVVERPDVDRPIGDYLGGVAVVVENMTPPATISDLTDRIRSMGLQPPHHAYGYRKWEVVGLEQVPDAAGSAEGEAYYRTAVVLARDDATDYRELPPEALVERGGLADTEWRLVRDALTRETSLDSVSSFSPQVSRSMQVDAIVAIALSLLAVVAYIWLRFGSIRYGLAAIVALVHDVGIALGLLALVGLFSDTALGRALMLSDFKIDLAIVAAILTIVGYSLNDTIVIFDRIRENRGRLATATPAIVNDSINQTISRTVLTSFTTSLALVVLYTLGGAGVHGFAFTMLIGVAVGTYSSVAIAAPILLIGAGRKK